MKMSRNEFLRSIIGIGVGAAGISALAACGGSDGDDEPPVVDGPVANRSCSMNGTSVSVTGSGHDHQMDVSMADVMRGVEKTYTMTGNGHTHPFTVTAAMFAMLQNNTNVTQSFMHGGDNHTVTITCR